MLVALALLLAADGTETSSRAPAIETVEDRRFAKDGRILARAGFGFLERGDLRRHPGISLDVSYYLGERFAIDLLSADVYFSRLTTESRAVYRETGYVPNSHAIRARAAAGARYALAYGKLLFEPFPVVLHGDLSVAAHGGVLFAEAPTTAGDVLAIDPTVDVELTAQIALDGTFVVSLGLGWMESLELRDGPTLAGGPFFELGLGFRR